MKNIQKSTDLGYSYLLYEFLRLNMGFFCMAFSFFFISKLGDHMILGKDAEWPLIFMLGMSAVTCYFLCIHFINLRTKISLLMDLEKIKLHSK